MTASNILIQPNTTPSILAQWWAAYRSIFFRVLADSVVPPDQPMYCDIYFGDVPTGIIYYKTISAYSIQSIGGTNSVFDFDIQDAAQEWIQTFVPEIFNPNAVILPSWQNQTKFSYAACFVRFRGSSIFSNILFPETPIPIQGTATTQPTSGGGLQSNSLFIINASVAPNSIIDNTTTGNPLLYQLRYLQQIGGPGWNDQEIYPLSNLPPNPINVPLSTTSINLNPSLCPDVYAGDSGILPILIEQFETHSPFSRQQRNCSLFIQYWFGPPRGPAAAGLVRLTASQLLEDGPYYLPYGLKEIDNLAPTLTPIFTNVNNDVYYYIILTDDDASRICFNSPFFHCKNTGIEEYRLWFQNFYGHFEQVSFVRNSRKISSKSSTQFTPYVSTNQTTGGGVDPSLVINSGQRRYNIREESEISLTATFPEALIPWLEELMLSPYCLVDVKKGYSAGAFTGTFYNLKSYSVIDGSYDILKTVTEGRVNYEVTIKIRPAIETTTLRN